MLDRARRLRACAAGPAPPRLLRDEGELDARGAADLRRGGLRLRHRLRRRARARPRRRCRPGARRLLGRRQVARGDAAGAARARALLQRREPRRARAAERGGRGARRARAGQPARQPRCRRGHPPLHLDRAEGQQVRHRPRPGARGLPAAAALPALEVAGIDCHIGSQITQAEPYLDAIERVLDLVEADEADGIALRHIDVGGGLGITYTDERPPRADDLVRRLLARFDARGLGERELLFEPGRSLVGNAGVLLTEVMVLMPGETKNFCVVDAAMNDLVRPAMYGATMAIEPCAVRARSAIDVGRGRADLRVGRLARSRPHARRRPGRLRRGAVGGRVRDGDGQQLQHAPPRRRAAARRRCRCT